MMGDYGTNAGVWDGGSLYVSEDYVEVREDGKRYGLGVSGVYESFFTTDMPRSAILKELVKQHGRCVGRSYADMEDGTVIQTGYVFQARRQYDDSPGTYLCETWVTFHTAPPTSIRLRR